MRVSGVESVDSAKYPVQIAMSTAVVFNPSSFMMSMNNLQQFYFFSNLNVNYPSEARKVFEVASIFDFQFLRDLIPNNGQEIKPTEGFDRNNEDALFLKNSCTNI